MTCALDRVGRERAPLPNSQYLLQYFRIFRVINLKRNTVNMAEQGTVKWFNDAKGYALSAVEWRSVFVPFLAIQAAFQEPAKGQTVQSTSPKALRLAAENCRRCKAGMQKAISSEKRLFSSLLCRAPAVERSTRQIAHPDWLAEAIQQAPPAAEIAVVIELNFQIAVVPFMFAS